MADSKNVLVGAEKVVEYLKHEVRLKSIQQQILHRQIILNTAQELGVSVSPEEIQAEADQFRYHNRLEDASQTYQWLNEQLITPDDWEQGIQERLLAEKLAHHLFDKQVERYFAQNKTQYEQVILYRILVPYQPLAQELFYQIEEEEISFFEAAHLYDTDERRRLACGFEGKFSRWQLNADLSARVFGAKPRDVIGVIHSTDGHELWMPEDFIESELRPEVRQQILDQLFNEWLDRELTHFIHYKRSDSQFIL